MSIKKKILFIHRWLGIISGLLVVFVAITGSMLAFEDEGRDYLQHDYYHIAHPGSARLSLDRMVDSFRVYNPKIKINSIRFKEKADAAVVFFTKDKYVFVDPYTSRVTATVPVKSDFFYVVKLLHTSLMLGDVGKAIVHINVLLFFMICLSGLVMWWPRKWSLFRSAVTIKTSASRKRVNYDLHRALGFYALPVLLIISFTGLFMASDVTKKLVSFVTASPMPNKDEEAVMITKPADAAGATSAAAATGATAATGAAAAAATGPGVAAGSTGKMHAARRHYSLDSAYAYARTHYPGALETFVVPPAKETPIRIAMRYPYTITRNQNTFYFNPRDGSLVKADLYADYNGYDKMARSNYNLHTGKIGPLGIFSKIIWCMVALIAASLPITGFCIWMGKKKKKKRDAIKESSLYLVSTGPETDASRMTKAGTQTVL
ncbi:MAG TPA: PepSY-associated TM helix domain-containing protein [Puia sp.]|nr:PepSY-associated TM helix domain-containing protein [Puia sp.]